MSAHIDVRYVAGLSRLHLQEEEIVRFQEQLDQVLGYVEQLRNADVSGADADAGTQPGRCNVLRADVERPGFEPQTALQNAPRQASGLFIVPKVVE